ncbi:SRPBCC family protein [Parasphingopyxis marina]|uniref:SRPBCC family protein n=1 Tax=Parasphingopyxis marina TaxID=2761622 RepID=A0A842HSL5_9SPHN|nr:SRPBCC family protein [Parasphingopyxis marina]MBC2776828.1 SRPBCC family protein [Parasphingopyxis marina]
MREDFGTQLEDGSLRFVRDLPGPIERVWAYLVDPEKRALWFCDGTMGGQVGDSYTMAFDHDRLSHEPLPERYAGMQGGIEMKAEILAIDPPRLIVFCGVSEDAETRIELEPLGERVRLTLTQAPPADFGDLTGTAGGWHAHLAILVDHLEGRVPRGFWTEHEEARGHYEGVLKPAG